MKKWIAFVLLLTCVAGMVGCNQQDAGNRSETREEEIVSFGAKVLEVNENYLLVEPFADSSERKSADKIVVSLVGETAWPIPAVGDTVTVFYSGGIQETYPARIAKVHRVEIGAKNSYT